MKHDKKIVTILGIVSIIGFIIGIIYTYITMGFSSHILSGIAGICFAAMPLMPFYNKLIPPLSLTLWLYLFNISSILLGTIFGFYNIFEWWDIYLHTTSGLLIAWIGFFLIERLNMKHNVFEQMNRFIVYVFGFTLPLALGVLWEILEFISDQLLGTNLQRSGLMDTMSDLIVATIGSVIATILYIILDTKKRNKA